MKKIIAILAFIVLAGQALMAQSLYRPEEYQIKSPAVPKMVVFAGDTIRFDRPDLYERMDRELMAFTYTHTTSLLMLKRSPRYFRQVEPILAKYGIPDDLKYLMVIESNLDPKAQSNAGAAGLWQFTRPAAKESGLIIDEEVDERFNIEKETIAACQYFKKAYEKFGDWMTVAACFNSGMAGTEKRLVNQRKKCALDIWLAEETSRYMFRVLAAKMMFERPSLFGFDVPEDERYPYYPPKQTITISGPVENLVDLAEQYGVSYRQLKEANLWLRDSKLINKAHRTYSVIIPSR